MEKGRKRRWEKSGKKGRKKKKKKNTRPVIFQQSHTHSPITITWNEQGGIHYIGQRTRPGDATPAGRGQTVRAQDSTS